MDVDVTTLPDDPALLKKIIVQMLLTQRMQERAIVDLLRKLGKLPRVDIDPAQQLFDFLNEPSEEGAGGAPNELPSEATNNGAAAEAATTTETSKKKQKGHGRRRIPKDLPQVEKIVDLDDAEKPCPCCGGERVRIGAETSKQMEYRPAEIFVNVFIRPKYACKKCEGHVAIAPLPPTCFPKCLAGPDLLSHIVVSKYCDHLPLYRQESILERLGLSLSRSTMCDWMAGVAGLFEPIVERMKRLLLLAKILHTDDTSVQVRDQCHKLVYYGHLWVYIDPVLRYHCFDFTPTRERDGPMAYLNGFTGYLQADAYSGYDRLFKSGVTEVACWNHARMKFVEAESAEPLWAQVARAYIRQLYDVEDEADGMCNVNGKRKPLEGAEKMTPDERRTLRQAKSLPILSQFKEWLDARFESLLPKSPFRQAVGYVLNQWEALCRYCENGNLQIDNSLSERAFQQFIVKGRLNWAFVGSENGGKTAAIHFSIVATCRLLDINVFDYYRDVLRRLPTHPADRLDELLPDNWAKARAAQASVANPVSQPANDNLARQPASA